MTPERVAELKKNDVVGVLPHRSATSPYLGTVLDVGPTVIVIGWQNSRTWDAIAKTSPVWYGIHST